MDKYVIGCDVSKNKLELALLLSVEPLKVRSKVVSNDHSGCMALIEWACRQAKCTAQQLQVVMEATGVYHEAAAYALLEAGVGVSVANPARVREFAKGLALRNKTDALDRMVLARYGATVKLPLWQPPAAEVVELKALLSRLEHPRLARDRQLLESIPAIGRKTANRMLCLLHARAFAAAPAAAAYLGLVPVQHRSGSSVYRPPHLSKAGPSAMRAALYMPLAPIRI